MVQNNESYLSHNFQGKKSRTECTGPRSFWRLPRLPGLFRFLVVSSNPGSSLTCRGVISVSASVAMWPFLCVTAFLNLSSYKDISHVGFGEGNGTPLQYSCLENPMDGGAWWAAVHGVEKSRTRLSDFTFTFHFQALEKEMATHSSVLAWRIPETAEPGGLQSMGSHRVRHNWSDLAATAAACWIRGPP